MRSWRRREDGEEMGEIAGEIDERQGSRRVGRGAYSERKNDNTDAWEEIVETHDLHASGALKQRKQGRGNYTFQGSEGDKTTGPKVDCIITTGKLHRKIIETYVEREKPVGKPECGHAPAIVRAGVEKKKHRDREEGKKAKPAVNRTHDRQLARSVMDAERKRQQWIIHKEKEMRDTGRWPQKG